MDRLNPTTANEKDITRAVNTLIDGYNDEKAALEALLKSEMECTCEGDEACSSCPPDRFECEHCADGPCTGTCVTTTRADLQQRYLNAADTALFTLSEIALSDDDETAASASIVILEYLQVALQCL